MRKQNKLETNQARQNHIESNRVKKESILMTEFPKSFRGIQNHTGSCRVISWHSKSYTIMQSHI